MEVRVILWRAWKGVDLRIFLNRNRLPILVTTVLLPSVQGDTRRQSYGMTWELKDLCCGPLVRLERTIVGIGGMMLGGHPGVQRT